MANVLKLLQDIFTPQFLYLLIKVTFFFLLVLISTHAIFLLLNPLYNPREIVLVEYNPFDPFRDPDLRRIRQDMNGLFGDLVKKIDLGDRDKALDMGSSAHQRVPVDLPGLSKEDIKINLYENYLVISGETKKDQEHRNGGVLTHERQYGKFWRSIPLPSVVDTSKVEARFNHGVVEIKLPRAQEASVQQITVQ
ncbi:hypothetical protein G9A89_023023 [Geosiphon pyriformis]|nr:hypothetical protein G9A89_023023 [Geosiphon pyriformis]